MNKPQAEGNINSRLYNRGRNSNKPFSSAAILDCMKNRMHEKKVQNCSVIKKKHEVQMLCLSNVIFAYYG